MTSDKRDPPNLDLIQMVQRARMQHDADAVPSDVGGVYWIEAKPERPAQQPTPRAGMWVIETAADRIDAQWTLVKEATRDGTLGYKSKVSTAARRGTAGANQRLIHVCTYDREDAADVERVRAALGALGLTPARYE